MELLEVAVDSNVALSFSHCLPAGKKDTSSSAVIIHDLLNEQLHNMQRPWQVLLFRACCHGNWSHAPNLRFFGTPWSERSRIRNPDPDPPKGTHPQFSGNGLSLPYQGWAKITSMLSLRATCTSIFLSSQQSKMWPWNLLGTHACRVSDCCILLARWEHLLTPAYRTCLLLSPGYNYPWKLGYYTP